MILGVKLLGWLAQAVIRKYRPLVIAITGSVGKTSTKDAIYTVLASNGSVRKTAKNYNNELGVPLTVLGLEAPGRNPLAWLYAVAHGLELLLTEKTYPKVLVLEMGADKVGDIAYLTRMTEPHIGILTGIGASHLEKFGSVENIVKEKTSIISCLRADGLAIVSLDDPIAATVTGKTKARLVTYGCTEHADVSAQDIHLTEKEGVYGLAFKVHYNGSIVPMFIPQLIGRHQLSALLAAIVVGINRSINLLTIGERLQQWRPTPGRMHLVSGRKQTYLIDDTYNAAPQSAKAALSTLAELGALRQAATYAILGDMLELGDYMQAGHEEVGHAVFQQEITYLITVGSLAQHIALGAKTAGMDSSHIMSFKTTAEAIAWLETHLEQGSTVLIKGSQGARMEKVTKALMADQSQAGELLVRQTEEWLRK
jgi:UDP-N-acetylmuramoyl-tripeptide--D-alanyl-D-alanine ligase